MKTTVSHCDLVDENLKELLNRSGTLWEAARYAVLGGGKRLRPVLTLMTAETLGADPALAVHPACAVEMIHAYSMVHDDLPCMDDDDFRRGRLTVHRAYDEATAVLVGDLLLTYAFEIAANSPGLSAEQGRSLCATLAAASGGNGLIAGQHLDLSLSGSSSSLSQVEAIHRGKTAALIAASVAFGGIVAGVESPDLTAFGLHLGLAFQIIDDVLDVTHAELKHGRASDSEQDKATYVKHLGIEGARVAAHEELERALGALSLVEADTSGLESLARKFVDRQK